ncbi:hypothetical protein C1752_02255 [Acaryochloris thomasi RCC1774]|uniref:Uncharacterized protein n=1 Tax=Acaryochloris thomasi RCC1774 TaxID=1764569 RepID=A0A2W1JYV0_9CYAN|nr:hypothetical protein [Acaryochloris thomasi]PZD73357.1 hypothetical protein C1752_02255 [Acaryochloris thomasi RCC1774]
MNIDQQLIDEIKSQMEDDILYFGWMVQIARLQNPARIESDSINAVIEAVVKLHSDGTIVVGKTYESNGMVLIDAWSVANKDLRTQIESEVASHDSSGDQSFCFWIQLAEHYTS